MTAVQHVQLLDTCEMKSIIDYKYRRHLRRFVYTTTKCIILGLHISVWTGYKTVGNWTDGRPHFMSTLGIDIAAFAAAAENVYDNDDGVGCSGHQWT